MVKSIGILIHTVVVCFSNNWASLSVKVVKWGLCSGS